MKSAINIIHPNVKYQLECMYCNQLVLPLFFCFTLFWGGGTWNMTGLFESQGN